MKTVFKVGDLVRLREDSPHVRRSDMDYKLGGTCRLVLVTDGIESSKQFFYGRVCSTGETHLWTHDNFDLVQKGTQ